MPLVVETGDVPRRRLGSGRRPRRAPFVAGLMLLPAVVAAPGIAHAAPAAMMASAVPTAAAAPVQDEAGATQQRRRADQGLARGVDNWWFDAMGLAKVQRRTIGEGVAVAVLDSEIWPDAPDLAGIDLTVHQLCGPDPSVDNARRGSHGAAMVATLAGQGTRDDGRPGLRGVAPGVAVHYYGHLDSADAATDDCTAKQVVAAVDQGVDVISTSTVWVGDQRVLEEAVDYALDAGAVIVMAAGNAGQDFSQAKMGGFTGMVLTTQVNRYARPKGNVPPFLNQFSPQWNAVAAPGYNATGSGYVAGEGWVSGAKFTGTSNAAPIVAGQVALQKSVYPEATGNQLVQSLIHDTSNSEWEWNLGYGFGIAAITGMIDRDPTGWPDINPLRDTLPRQVLRRWPPDIYGTSSTDGADGTGTSEGASPGATPSSEPAADTEDTTSAAADAGPARAGSDTGFTGWGWPLAALATVGLVGLAVLLVRRRRTAPATPVEED